MTRYAKAVAALLGTISTWGVTAIADEGINGIEWFGLLGALGTIAAVYGIPNTPPVGQASDPNMSEQG